MPFGGTLFFQFLTSAPTLFEFLLSLLWLFYLTVILFGFSLDAATPSALRHPLLYHVLGINRNIKTPWRWIQRWVEWSVYCASAIKSRGVFFDIKSISLLWLLSKYAMCRICAIEVYIRLKLFYNLFFSTLSAQIYLLNVWYKRSKHLEMWKTFIWKFEAMSQYLLD